MVMPKKRSERYPIPSAIGDWISKQPGDKVLSAKEIASRIKGFREQDGDHRNVTVDQLNSILCQARKHCELTYKLTIWNVHGQGWRIATPRETAYYGMAATKKLLVLADRTRRLCDIVDRKYIPEAFEQVFGSTDNGVKTMLSRGKSFLLMWVKKQQEETTLLEDMTKGGTKK
jgi:hypothetical protein